MIKQIICDTFKRKSNIPQLTGSFPLNLLCICNAMSRYIKQRDFLKILFLFLLSVMPKSVFGSCLIDQNLLINGEAMSIKISEQRIATGAVTYFISLPELHNGESLTGAYLKIGDLVNDEGLIPLKVERLKEAYMTHLILQPEFESGAYLTVMYGRCNSLGKTVRVRTKTPK